MNVVIVPFHDFKKWEEEGFRTRDAHICEHFSKNNEIGKILVINRPTSLAEILLKKKKRIKELYLEYSHYNIRLSEKMKNVWCLDIFLPDLFKVALQKKMWWFTSFNYTSVIAAIKEACQYLQMEDAILLLQNPMAIGVAQELELKRIVFDAIDNWLYHPQMPDKRLIRDNYDYIDKNANLIMTVSQALLDIFPTNSNKYWVPNGVDIEYFEPAIKRQRSNRLIIGYVGKIQDRVDFELVERCLKKYPNYEFVFLGPVYSQNEKIKLLQNKYKNIVFKGDIHYNELPGKMKCFDIAIIPHKIDKFTNSMNPLKLYEYLAAGKPVVTTGVAGTTDVSPYVRCVCDNDEFVEEIGNLVNEFIDSIEVVNTIPKECTWVNRTNTIITLFKEMQ